ncbi:MAG: cupredoxin family copper-binding protein [Nanoarchaeota archaeon]|jgi:plastocyanin|nr:cupredoxin family copper-binding protein [Nanoarchaeota archaeon]
MRKEVWFAFGMLILLVAVGVIFNGFQTGNVISEPITPTGELPVPATEIPIDSPGELAKPKEITSDYEIKIINFAYSPVDLEINVGDTVSWENRDTIAHTITSEEGSELNSRLLGKGEKYIHTFNTRGTYDYYCKPHPYMKGSIIVK